MGPLLGGLAQELGGVAGAGDDGEGVDARGGGEGAVVARDFHLQFAHLAPGDGDLAGGQPEGAGGHGAFVAGDQVDGQGVVFAVAQFDDVEAAVDAALGVGAQADAEAGGALFPLAGCFAGDGGQGGQAGADGEMVGDGLGAGQWPAGLDGELGFGGLPGREAQLGG